MEKTWSPIWSDKWRSTLSYSAITIDNNTDLSGFGETESTKSINLNIFYQAAKNLKLGAEIQRAVREIESGDDGNMDRLQFVAQLGF